LRRYQEIFQMLRKLAGLLGFAAQSLEELSDSEPENSAPDEAEESVSASAETEQSLPQGDKPPPTPIWQHFVTAEREHLSWLRSHLYIVAIVLGLVAIVTITEQGLIQAWTWLTASLRLYWPVVAQHPVALIAFGLALFYLIFGLQWLRSVDDLLRWTWHSTKRRPRLTALSWAVLLLIGFWVINNHGTWVISPFTVGQTETLQLTGEQVAIQLIAELNQVGVGNPTPVLSLWELQEPRTLGGRVTARRDLPFEECDSVLKGPGDYTRRFQPIPLTRVLAGSQGNRLDLGNLSIGAINIPSQIFTQFLLKLLPTGYREFNGQISESKGQLEISISSTNPSRAWRISGPSETFPEMIEYLALRMALDLNPELIKASGLDVGPSDRDLAFAMGNQAFRQQNYERAAAFYQLADQLAPLDEKVDAMLGLAEYHLALQQPEDDPHRFDVSTQLMQAAVDEDPNGDSSLLRPYLICLYYKAGAQSQAEAERLIFAQYLRRLEFQDFEVRVEALKQLPLRGPGRHLAATDGEVVFVNEVGAIVDTSGQSLPQGEALNSAELSPSQSPRQIQVYGDSRVMFISADGAVFNYDGQISDDQTGPTTLIDGRVLGGVQQIATSASQFGRVNLFLLNRFGEVYWCEPEAETGTASACPPRRTLLELTDVRQIFPVEDRLYVLAEDGAVWYTAINVSGRASFAPRQLTPPAQVQEIFLAGDDTLYLLHDNGNVWRYYNDGRPETEDLKLVDPGTGTAQIFAADNYLYLLKRKGAIWRINNSRNPIADKDFAEIWSEPGSITVQEMFITAPSTGQDSVASRKLYLLTENRMLLEGIDTGDARLTFSPIYPPSPAQTKS
jgi:tetratricopeptide (TPR) repeat protein